MLADEGVQPLDPIDSGKKIGGTPPIPVKFGLVLAQGRVVTAVASLRAPGDD
jgi:hypothetical protein